MGKVTITTEPTSLRVGSQDLQGRKQLIVINDAANVAINIAFLSLETNLYYISRNKPRFSWLILNSL